MARLLRRTHQPLLALILTALAASPLLAQAGSLAGTIEDEATGSPLGTVLVEAVRPDGSVAAGVLSSAIGTFRIPEIPTGQYTVRFTLAGWETHDEPNVSVANGRTTSLAVQMVERVYNLNPITVTASKREEKVLDAPSAIEVVSPTEIEETPTVTLADYVVDLPGVDVIRTGLQGSYVTTRGFNNIFSGAALVLTDNRIARVPSLRANISHLQPTTSLDVDRIEVVLGPGSALYGPNAADGVIHNITKSPIDDPGLSLSTLGGLRSQDAVPGYSSSTEPMVNLEGRYALRTSEEFGIKLSGNYLAGTDWFFDDPEEARQRQFADACLQAVAMDPSALLTAPDCLNFSGGLDLSDPSDQELLAESVTNVAGGRDFDLESWALDLRSDWRPSTESQFIFSGGVNTAVNSIDLTGIGAAQVTNWKYYYGQARYTWRNLFAQVFYNRSDNDETYLLRSGRPLIDKSSLFGAQLQYSSQLGENWNLIYGGDLLLTRPRTEGTINGINENNDDNTEYGGYVQANGVVGGKTDLVGAFRLDYSELLDQVVFSPRVAVVQRLDEEQNVRLTYNRAFSTPTTLNFFLDISAQSIPLGGPLRYDVRAQGITQDGLSYSFDQNGVAEHQSPFNLLLGGDSRAFLPTTTPQLWTEAIAAVSAVNPGAGALLQAIPAPTNQDIGIDLLTLNTDPNTNDAQPFIPTPGGLAGITNIPTLDPTITNTFEIGYKGILDDKLLLAVNGYVSIIQDFISALRVISPNTFLNGQDVGAYLAQNFLPLVGLVPALPDTAAALAAAADLATQIGRTPLGVITPTRTGGTDPVIGLTYQNLGDVTLWGGELSGTYLVTPEWELNFAASYVNKDQFDTDKNGITETVPLNAPKFKGSLGFGYRNLQAGFNGSTKVVYRDGFPANSGVYVGEVDNFASWDLLLGYKLKFAPGLGANFRMVNILDTQIQMFPGTAPLGRYTALQLVYTLP
jgi:outer membrane receptor for ferrienterochelin and colicins